MTKELNIYSMPNVGCMLGAAYQVLVVQLQAALSDAGLDLSVPEYLVMRTLYSRDGLQQCEIADILGKDKAAVCRCIKKMLEKGLVRAESVSHKCLRIYVDSKGREIHDDIMAVSVRRHRALESLLTRNEMSTFTTVLRKILDNQ